MTLNKTSSSHFDRPGYSVQNECSLWSSKVAMKHVKGIDSSKLHTIYKVKLRFSQCG